MSKDRRNKSVWLGPFVLSFDNYRCFSRFEALCYWRLQYLIFNRTVSQKKTHEGTMHGQGPRLVFRCFGVLFTVVDMVRNYFSFSGLS